MAHPHPALVDLARGISLGARARDGALARSAFDHGVQGLLWTQVRAGAAAVDGRDRDDLVGNDLLRQRQARQHWSALEEVQEQLCRLGVETVALKGVTAEWRWYDRLGERPTSDIDLWLDPGSITRFAGAVAYLDPEHPLRHDIGAMVAAGDCQGIEVTLPGVTVDLHADPYKIRARLPGLEGMFQRRVRVVGPDGAVAWALAPEDALVQQLVHLSRDWYRSLLGYVDLARIVQRGQLDWPALWARAEADGLTDLVVLVLREVDRVVPLGVPLPPDPEGWRARVWHRTWPEQLRLSGHEDVPQQRSRRDVLTLLVRGHGPAALRRQWRTRLFPSRAMVDHAYPGRGGPYLWRLAAGRWNHLQAARQPRWRRDPGPSGRA